jgi:SH3-like domain-containing protein
MKFIPTALVCLLALTIAAGASAETLTPPPGSVAQSPPPSQLGQAAGHPSTPHAAPVPPVVREHGNPHAQKPPAKKTTAKPAPAPAPAAPPPVPTPAPTPTPTPAPDASTEAAAPPAVDLTRGSVTHLPIPRFMSLRFDDVNLRVGPGLRYPIDWVYHRRDLPVEVIRELDDWRLVQDQDNIRGWVRAPALSPRRGFVVRTAESTLRAKPTDDSSAVALLKPGVVGHVRKCDDGQVWCEIDVGSYRGYLRRDQIYGVYPTEAVGG